MNRLPSYLWGVIALIAGILLGGLFSEALMPLAELVKTFIKFIVKIVPVLIFLALSPSIATLTKRGLAGRFGLYVILWYVLTSVLAGFLGVVFSSIIFNIPLVGNFKAYEAVNMLKILGNNGISKPLLAILGAVLTGLISVKFEFLYKLFISIQNFISLIGKKTGIIMTPLIFLFGIQIGCRFGAKLGLEHYGLMTLYTVLLCVVWWLFYLVILKFAAKQNIFRLLKGYFIPTALFAAGTCSSMATFPFNLINVKKYGVRDEVADFVIPFGAVANMDASAMAYIAYGPFIIKYIFGFDINWLTMLVVWPAVVLFTVAAPGLPAGMGTGLWSSTLFASILGLDEATKSVFVATWIALASGIPDMFRTALNSTGDGFTSILFDSIFDKFFNKHHFETQTKV